MTTTDFYKNVAAHMKSYPRQRYGQAVFNVMYVVAPEFADEMRGKSLDPFYDDTLAPDFVLAAEIRGVLDHGETWGEVN